MQGVIMLSVIKLSVTMLSVVAPSAQCSCTIYVSYKQMLGS
jgi:hypothetical protein